MSEADRTKLMRSACTSTHNEGVRPVRKRGYHRALKRGEVWALFEKSQWDIINKLLNELYYGPKEQAFKG